MKFFRASQRSVVHIEAVLLSNQSPVCEVLNTQSNVHFPRNVPIFRACKNAKIALQHPIIFGVLASPWTTLKTEKRKFAFSWEMKSVSGHLKFELTSVIELSETASLIWFDWYNFFIQVCRKAKVCLSSYTPLLKITEHDKKMNLGRGTE